MKINKNDINPVVESDSDKVHRLARVALSAFSGVAVEIFNTLITPPLEKRRVKWMCEVTDAINMLLENKMISLDELQDNEQFFTALIYASQTALKNHQKEKLEALKNAILNVALNKVRDEDIQIMFLHFIDDLTPWHLKILKCLEDYQNKMDMMTDQVRRKWLGITDTVMRVINNDFPELEIREDFVEQILRDLSSRGLTTSGLGDERNIDQHPNYFTITKFGKEFQDFIKSSN